MATADTAQLTGQLLQLVQELATELHPQRGSARSVSLDTRLGRDLGLDSLARIELLARIERRLQVTLPERTLAEAESVRDLLRAVLADTATPTAISRLEVATDTAPSQAVPHQARTLLEVLDWHLRQQPERNHVRFYSDAGDGEQLNFSQLREGAARIAGGLQAHGLLPGETVALMLPSAPDYFFTFFGILLAGGIPVPIYPPLRLTQLEEHLRRHRTILANCNARLLVTGPEARAFSRLLKSQLGTLSGIVTPAELVAAPATRQPVSVGAQDTALLQYTSGSTGTPRGVILTHANLLANIRAMGERLQADSRDIFVSWLPLYHDMGLIGAWLGSLYYGARLVLLSPLQFLSRPQRWLWAIHRHRGTLSAAPNFGYSLCLHRLEEQDLTGLDLSSWRAAFNGAEPVIPATLEQFATRFAPYGLRREALMPVYGLAECSVGLAIPPLGRGPRSDRVQRLPLARDGQAIPAANGDEGALCFASCGQPLAGHDIRIVDAAGRELQERWEGRLQFRGPSATSGYYRNPEDTRRLFRGDWLESGDLAYMADGEVFITGRTKDVIIRAGRNIYPHELEAAVGELPGIRKGNVAVFGSHRAGDAVERLVVLAETKVEDEGEQEGLRRRIDALAAELIELPPDEIILAAPGTVLKTSSGKIRHAACRQAFEQGKLGRGQGPVWWQALRVVWSGLAPAGRRLGQALTATLFAGYGWGLFYLLAGYVVLALLLLPRQQWRWCAARGAVRLLRRATGTALTVTGTEQLPREGGCILVANHASYLDAYVLIAALDLDLGFVAKAELGQKPLLRLLLERIGTHFVERFDLQQGVEDARRLAQAAGAGQSLCFFPEGTFTRLPGLRPFHMGAFVAGAEAGLPVVPVAIRGTRSMLRADSWFPRRGAIAVAVGPALRTTDGADTWGRALRLRDGARDFILQHCGEPRLPEDTG